MKKINLICILICAALFFACDNEPDGPKKYTSLYLEQSKLCWDVRSNNYFVDMPASIAGSEVELKVGAYQNYAQEKTDITVDIIIDSDSLEQAILKAKDGNVAYTIYKNAKLLPAEYYSIPEKITLKADESISAAEKLVFDTGKILNDPYAKTDGYFILPVRISTPDRYGVIKHYGFVMFVLRFPGAGEAGDDSDREPDFSEPTEYEGYRLVWSDEFNETGSPDPEKWNFERGFVRNQELQWYQSDNAVCGDGVLTIYGKKENVKNPNYEAGSSDWKKNREYANYTSASLNTWNKMHFKFGKLVVRAKIPTQTGAWPAIWTLGEKYDWPSCGEADILEFYPSGGVPRIHANFAWGTNTAWQASWKSWNREFSYFTGKDPDWSDKYHEWVYDWNENQSFIYLDGELLRDVWTNSMWNGSVGEWKAPFHQPHYVLLNLALGGNGGNPLLSDFPMEYKIDYVRVYEKAEVPE